MRILSLVCFLLLACSLLPAQDPFELLYIKGDYDQILEESRSFKTPGDYYWHSFILDKKGKTLEAIDLLSEGAARFDNPPVIELLLSDLLYKTGRYSKAKPILSKHLDNSESFIKYINILEFQESYKLAAGLLEAELLKDSSNLVYLGHLGDNYYQSDSTEKAIQIFAKILKINPEDQNTAARLASLLLKNKNYDEAVSVCNTSLEKDSTNEKLIRIKGLASFNKSDYITSCACFAYLNEQGDSGKFVLKHLGISEFHNDSLKNAGKHLMQAFLLDTTDFETCYMLGKYYQFSAEPEKGLFYFDHVEKLLQPDPKVISTLYTEKKSIYSRVEKYDDAVACLQKAFDYNPKPEYLFYMASLYQNNLDDPKAALEHYERFLGMLPERADNTENKPGIGPIAISLRSVAERNVNMLREELFFNGDLE